MAAANQEARNVAILVSGLHDDPRLGRAGHGGRRARPGADQRADRRTGTVLGRRTPGLARDPTVRRAPDGKAFTRVDDAGGRDPASRWCTGDGTDVVRTTVSAEVLHRGVVRAWIGIAAARRAAAAGRARDRGPARPTGEHPGDGRWPTWRTGCATAS